MYFLHICISFVLKFFWCFNPGVGDAKETFGALVMQLVKHAPFLPAWHKNQSEAMPLMDKSIMYHMGCSSKSHIIFSLAPCVICMQCVIDFFFGKADSPSCQSSSHTTCNFFCCYFGGSKRKGSYTFRTSWIRIHESINTEMVVIP